MGIANVTLPLQFAQISPPSAPAADTGQESFALLLKALGERHQREQQAKELAAQLGQLKLQQDKFAGEQKQRNEQKKALEDLGRHLSQKMGEMAQPGILESAAQTGNPEILQKTVDALQTWETHQTLQGIIKKYEGVIDPAKRAFMFDEMAGADPTHSGAYVDARNKLLQREAEPRGNVDTVMVNGVPKRVLIFPNGSYKIVGDAPPIERVNRPVMGEREKASAAVAAIPAAQRLRELDKQYGVNVANRVYTKVANAYGAGGFLGRFVGKVDARVIESKLEATMTPEEKNYYAAEKQFLSAIIPGLAGKNVTGNELITHGQALFSTGNATPDVLGQKELARNLRVQNAIAEAGPAWADRALAVKDYDLTPYGIGTAQGAIYHLDNPYAKKKP